MITQTTPGHKRFVRKGEEITKSIVLLSPASLRRGLLSDTNWACVSRKQKIAILVLSSAMSSNLREILDSVCYPEIFLSFSNDKEKKKIGSKKKMLFWSFINNLLV